MTNHAAVMTRLGVIEIQERPEPRPGPRDAVVQVEAVGVCGSDAAYFTVGYIGDYVVDGPIILGHETSGVVVDVGSEVSRVHIGDRVAIEPGQPCRDCRECLAGRYHLCPDLVFMATPPYDGSLIQRLVTDERTLFVMPEQMSFEDAALLEPLSVGLWACKRSGLMPGDNVLVSGAGPVGVLAAEAARAFGAGRVTVTDVADDRLALAGALGHSASRAEELTGSDFDVLLECSGAPGALAAGLTRLRENGRAAMVGMPKKPVELALSQLNPKELTIALVNRYQHTWPLAMELVSSGRVRTSGLVTGHFSLDETADALLAAQNVPGTMKAVIHPQMRKDA